MLNSPTKNLLPWLRSRREYFDYLDRWTVGAVDELRARMSTRALTKAFLLETSRANGFRNPEGALSEGEWPRLDPIDETLFRMRWPNESEDWALVEVEDERYPVIYTAVESDVASRRIDQIVDGSALLDRAWFSASMFRELWRLIVSVHQESRFSRIVFEHESVYQRVVDDPLGQSEESEAEESDHESGADEQPLSPERRRARMQITERIGRMEKAVLPWEERYDPLASIVQMRIPAPSRGGYDVYFNGRFTNRSDSTTSFREAVRDVMKQYRSSTQKVEDAAWPIRSEAQAGQRGSIGAPLLIRFSEPLDSGVFDRWVAALRRRNNRFRLWGTPIPRGPGKVHFYAVDNHLWQPIDLEIARDHVYALLPDGTCGNTVHRLVTNIQRFVEPKISVFVGERPYEDFVGKVTSEGAEPSG